MGFIIIDGQLVHTSALSLFNESKTPLKPDQGLISPKTLNTPVKKEKPVKIKVKKDDLVERNTKSIETEDGRQLLI